MSKLVTQPSFGAVGQTHAERQTFEKPQLKGQCMTVRLGLVCEYSRLMSGVI